MTDKVTIFKRIGFASIFAEMVKCLGEYFKEFGMPITSSMLADFEQACKAYRDQMSKRGQKLKIAVAGKFSCGKSQFINSLTGHEIAAVDLARTTCCKTIFTGDPSIDDIVILDSLGNSITRDKYVELSSKNAASSQEFVVKIPDADWTDFEIIDTPGYDSVEESDRLISEGAVNEADVVLFLFDMGNGTIPKDSIDYLKKVARSDQLFYLVANKADLKPAGARQTIIESIADECSRKGIKYECVLPYSSLTPWSKEVLQKSEPMRSNVLKLAEQLKEGLFGVVDKLVEREQQIRAAKVSRLENDLREGIERCWYKFCDAISTFSIEKFLKYFSEVVPDTDDTVESVTNALMGFAAEFTAGVSTRFIHWREVPGTGIFWTNWQNDWRVSLDLPTDEYDSLGQGAVLLLQHLMNIELSGYQLSENLPAMRLIDLIKPSSIEVIRQLANNSGYSERCVVKSECRDAEGRIQERLNSEFPDVFHEICRPKVAKIIETLKSIRLQKMLFTAMKPIADAYSNVTKCLDAFGIDAKEWRTYIAEVLNGIDNVNPKAARGCSHGNGSGDEIVSTVEGVVDGLCVEDGSMVKQGDRLLTINVLNIHWPINAIGDGRVRFKVKFGERVRRGNVLATIS